MKLFKCGVLIALLGCSSLSLAWGGGADESVQARVFCGSGADAKAAANDLYNTLGNRTVKSISAPTILKDGSSTDICVSLTM